MPAFYVLISYLLGIYIGKCLNPNVSTQVLIVFLTMFCIFRAPYFKKRLIKITLLIGVINAGIIRSSYPSFGIFPIEWFEQMQIYIQPLKFRLLETMGTGLTEAQKELIGGIILGRGSGVMDIKNWHHFFKSGMSHLLVASGAQVSLSIFPLIILAEHISISQKFKKILFTIAALSLIFLLILVGIEPSILRAITSCYIYLFARIINRKCHSLNIIYITALFWLWINPSLIKNIGFQLSYSASWGLAYIYPKLKLMYPLREKVENSNFLVRILRKFSELNIELIFLLISAQCGVSPVLTHHFHRFSIAGFISNLIAVPLSSAILYLGLASAFLGMIFHPLALLINYLNGFLLNLLNLIALIFSSVPYFPSPKYGFIGLFMPYIFIGLFFEAKFQPHAIVTILDTISKITYPLESVKTFFQAKIKA